MRRRQVPGRFSTAGGLAWPDHVLDTKTSSSNSAPDTGGAHDESRHPAVGGLAHRRPHACAAAARTTTSPSSWAVRVSDGRGSAVTRSAAGESGHAVADICAVATE